MCSFSQWVHLNNLQTLLWLKLFKHDNAYKICNALLRNFYFTNNIMNKPIKLKVNLKYHSCQNGLAVAPMNVGLIDDAVEQAVSFLQQGHVIAVPTDTIYGIACLAQNSTGVRKLYEIKKREQSKPIAICVADIQDIPLWGHVTVSTSVLQELLPGPVTLIFERTPNLNVQLNPTVKFVGIRIPNCSFIRCVAHSCGAPLALTSANMSSHSSTLAVEEFKDLWPDLGAVFDGGHLGENDPLRLGSTVVDLSVKGYYHIVRSGCAEETTKKILEKYHLMEC
ncbi:yrdC domain-containing protein, mitochondrial-like isoform X3 [Limulus polyphemus]|uniref:Threonylcarbamoyl-AMP synthase n=1 Tax=Limulus polyphemus TaxID=6850 RepID=A0ABM1C5T3_LIMPO|nr:yrdC domain-containing protein, mitochondrial-like isoform X3 [Limulus polyphemus]